MLCFIGNVLAPGAKSPLPPSEQKRRLFARHVLDDGFGRTAIPDANRQNPRGTNDHVPEVELRRRDFDKVGYSCPPNL